MTAPLNQSQLEAYLDEALPSEQMAQIELALRDDPALLRQLAAISARRDAGLHSLGSIWRRHHISCLSRQQLGSYLLGALPEETGRCITFHLEVVGCRYCQANLADLKTQQVEQQEVVQTRRRRYFQSSAGYLRRK